MLNTNAATVVVAAIAAAAIAAAVEYGRETDVKLKVITKNPTFSHWRRAQSDGRIGITSGDAVTKSVRKDRDHIPDAYIGTRRCRTYFLTGPKAKRICALNS